MSGQKKAIIKERISAARKLAKEGRYDAARYILAQVEHPKAKTMLKALEGRQEKRKSSSLFSVRMLIMTIGGIISILGFIAALVFIPPLIEAPQKKIENDFYNESIGNITLSDEEVRYANLANYCYDYTGYGGELCLDWTEMVLADYADGLDNCLAPLIDADMPTDEIYAKVGTCLTDAGVPPPL